MESQHDESGEASQQEVEPKPAVPVEIAKILKKAEKTKAKAEAKGVCYMSYVPPYMNPSSLRKMIEVHYASDVERIYMEPERDYLRKNRMKTGGNRKRKYTEAWIEFAHKNTAKEAAQRLNNQLMGGKKRHNLFHDDMWNLRYLSGFKWTHLTEKLAYDAKVREQRLTQEMNLAKKEHTEYEEKRTLGKKLERM